MNELKIRVNKSWYSYKTEKYDFGELRRLVLEIQPNAEEYLLLNEKRNFEPQSRFVKKNVRWFKASLFNYEIPQTDKGNLYHLDFSKPRSKTPFERLNEETSGIRLIRRNIRIAERRNKKMADSRKKENQGII